MIKQWIDRHLDGEAKESAMVHEIKELRAKLAELEQQSFDLCPKCNWRTLIPGDGCLNCERTQEPAAWLNTLRSNGYQEADMRPASNTDMWINEPLYKRGTP